MVPPKKKSKRSTVRLRHKIQKCSNEKQRKERKAAKKDVTWKSKLPKNLGIPNSFPYKDKILAEIEETKRKRAEEIERKKEEAKAKRKALLEAGVDAEDVMEDEEEDDLSDEEDSDFMGDEGDVKTTNSAMAALLASAQSRAQEYEQEHESSGDEDEEDDDDDMMDTGSKSAGSKDMSRRAFDKIFKKVLDSADVILYVLDARDPEGTRSRTVERQIMAANAASGEKRLILILNKIDLVPPHVLKGWLTYLKRYFPTLPLKATTSSAPNAQTFNHKNLSATGTSAALFRALKSYAATKQLKRAISVGVIGFPNVGKSSIINALASRIGGSGNSCPTGAEAGVTTSIREIKLDKKLRLLDSPGIVFPSASDLDSSKKAVSKKDQTANLILLSALPPKQILDPIPAVTLLLKRLSSSKQLYDKLLNTYGLPALITSNGLDAFTQDFLVQVARKRGRFLKGGIPHIESAAMQVLIDWRDGRIQGWVEPPVYGTGIVNKDEAKGWQSEAKEENDSEHKQIVTEWGAEFKLEGLWGSGEGDEELVDDDEMRDE